MIVLYLLKNFMISFLTMKLILSKRHHLLLLSLPILLTRLILSIETRTISIKLTIQTIILKVTYNNIIAKLSTNPINNSISKSPVKYVTWKALLLRNVITCKLLFHGCFSLYIHLILYILLDHLLGFCHYHRVHTLLLNFFNLHQTNLLIPRLLFMSCLTK